MRLAKFTYSLSAAGLCLTLAAGCDEAVQQQQPALAVQTGGFAPTSGGFASSGGVTPASGGLFLPPGGGEFAGTGGVLTGTGAASAATGGSAAPADGKWCDALAVFRTSCQSCHGTMLQGGAPMSLVTYEDSQGLSTYDNTTPLTTRISERVHSATSPMPPSSQTPLTAAQLAAIDAWIAAGAPSAADPTCGGDDTPPGGEWEWPEGCEEFYTFVANSGGSGKHTVAANSETYNDFMFPVPWGGKGPVQALAVRPIVDSSALHHYILYQGNNFLTGWAPGGEPAIAGDNYGIYMPDSGTLKMTNHYYNMGSGSKTVQDASGVEICITRTLRPNTSATFPFVGPSSAPAYRRSENTDTCTVRLTDRSKPVFLVASSPHMHQLGVHAKLEVLRTDGSIDVVHDRSFDFADQVSTPLTPEVQLNDGDRVRTTCVYQNDTAMNVTFGEGSYDEMCFNFASYYPSCGFTCTPTDPINNIIQQSQGGGCPSD